MENGPVGDDADLKELPLEVPEKSFLSQTITSMLEKCASTILGQYVMEMLDQFMKIIENTSKWSLPQGI